MTENKTERVNIMISSSELTAIDDWGFANRIRTRANAIRQLCCIALRKEPDLLPGLKRSLEMMKTLSFNSQSSRGIVDAEDAIRAEIARLTPK